MHKQIVVVQAPIIILKIHVEITQTDKKKVHHMNQLYYPQIYTQRTLYPIIEISTHLYLQLFCSQ